MKKTPKSDIEAFIALPDSEKDRIVAIFENESFEQTLARSRPMNAEDRRRWRRFKARRGRPKVGKGAKTISLTMEKDLLKRADAYAKLHGITRSRLVADGLNAILNSAA